MTADWHHWQHLYPFESHYLDRGGLRLHYLDEYTGPGRREQAPPVVFVHGNPTWSFYFREPIRALRATHRCIAVDHIGCGLSDKPDASRYGYRLRDRVADLEALLDHLDLDAGVTLVVHDWGGMIGLTAALRRPQRIARLVILNTAAFLLPAGRELPWQLKLLHRDTALARFLVQGLNLFALGAAWTATAKGLPPDVRAGLLAPYDTPAHRLATRLFVHDIPLDASHPGYELCRWTDENLQQLSHLPMLILWGQHDFVFNDAFLDEWRRRFPAAEVRVFEDAGHYVLEDAAERIIPRMEKFLTETSPPDPGRSMESWPKPLNIRPGLPRETAIT